MLDLKIDREGAPPKDAATLVLVRAAAGTGGGVEVFCVERNKKSAFLGGAVVFPGGKLDPDDASPEWAERTTAPRAPAPGSAESPFANGEGHLRALAVAACRESLEEAAILPVAGGALDDADLSALRERLKTSPRAIRTLLGERGLLLDLGALYPLSRWITPAAESRRFDARFFVAVAPRGQSGAHDLAETTSSFWAAPADVLARFDAGEVQLAPPTHRTLTLLSTCATEDDALALASSSCLDPICPRLVPQVEAGGQTLALALPGDPEHDVRESRVPGESRYVLRGERWRPEDPPRT